MSQESSPGPWGDPSQWNMPPPGAGDRAPEPPQPVRNAVTLMYAGAVLTGISLLVTFAQIDEVRDEIEQENRTLDQDEIDTLVNGVVGFSVVLGLVMVGLWIWMAVKNREGRSWARVTATVLGSLNVGLTLIGLVAGSALGTAETGVSTLLGVVSAALAAVILVFLWQPDSTRYYDQMRFWGAS